MSKDPADDSEDAVDPDALRADLDAIKSAMGLEQRYPGQARMWLLYGAAIGLAAILKNVAFALELPSAGYVGIWFALVAVVIGAQWRLVSRTSGVTAPGVDWRQLFTVMVVALITLWASVGDVVGNATTGAERGAHFFSHVLVFLGLTFLVVGIVLGTERIELRDRLPFYAGGAWMLLLAGFIPHVRTLQLGGWAVFGALFALHSLIAYLVTRED
ncbi:hypothetical protein [Salinarchaeum laminariae]|uniref:hypothetical protein n=1 Tax=Salinarchaeum laminariae TaxID=869888 RepID=UPI0020C14F9A|nr:hypothetical protein [Salinarchaeum laminariae]